MVVLAAPSAAADVSIGLDDDREGRYVTDHVAPGATVSRTVRIGNDGEAPLEVEVSVGGAAIVDDRFTFDAEVPGADELVSWASVLEDRVTVPAGDDVRVDIDLLVPPEADAGERYGVIWAAVRGTDASGTSVVNRVGVRIYLSVGDGPAPTRDVDLELLAIERDDEGSLAGLLTVTNTGGRALDLRGEVTVGSAIGAMAPAHTVAPGDSTEVPIVFEPDADVQAGRQDATVVVRAAGIERSGEATVVVPDGAGRRGPPASITSPTDRPGGVPVALAALLAALVGAGVVVLARRRRAASSSSSSSSS